VNYRLKRVNSLLQREVSNIILMKIKDPRVKNCTITDVEISADLRIAKVFVMATGDSAKDEEVINALEHAKYYIQHELSQSVILKYLPELRFFIDDTQLKAERIEMLLKKLNKSEENSVE